MNSNFRAYLNIRTQWPQTLAREERVTTHYTLQNCRWFGSCFIFCTKFWKWQSLLVGLNYLQWQS